MSIDDLIARITKLAANQHGLVRLDQFEPAEHRRVRHLDDRGIIDRVATGVYRVNGSPVTWPQSLQAGLWALGKGAVVSHASAARLHRLDRFEESPSLEYTVVRGHRGRRPANLDVVVHSTTWPLNGDLRHIDGLAVTSPVRTILDLARAGVPTPLLEAAIDSALRLRLTTLGRLVQRVEEVKGPARRGVARLDDLLVTSGGHSVLERRFLQLVRRCGLPVPTPQVVHRDDGRHVARVDFLFEEEGLVVEVSGGRGHSTPSDRAKDARRRNELQRMGRTVLEFTYEDVSARESYVIRTLKHAGVSAP